MTRFLVRFPKLIDKERMGEKDGGRGREGRIGREGNFSHCHIISCHDLLDLEFSSACAVVQPYIV